MGSVVMVAGICNSVGGGVILTRHRGAGGGGEYLRRLQCGLLPKYFGWTFFMQS